MGTTLNKIVLAALAAAMACALAGCGQAASSASASASSSDASASTASSEAAATQEASTDRETIGQVALLQSLLQGDYYGSVSIADLKKHGDIGIGTFDKLNGELIMVDGVLYRAKGDGSVEVPDDSETIPFSNVTFFDADETQSVEGVSSFKDLEEILNAKVDELGPNCFYFARVDGTFSKMNVRSEYAQEEPYKPLVKALETDQTFFDYENVEGTVVALYCPDYMKELNNAGWHLHFVSKDGTKGGHVLDLAIDKANIAWDQTDNFNMMLPHESFFNAIDFTKDRSEEVKKAETNE
jgi:acetolactate decarboxylase